MKVATPTLALLLAAGAVLAPASASARGAHVPDWVRSAAAAPLPPLQPRDAAAVLLDQTEITVNPAGLATVHRREVIRILTPAGRTFGEYALPYQSGSHVHFLHAWTIGSDKHEYQQDDRDETDGSAVPDFEVFDSERIRVAHALAAEPGAVVAFESELVEDRNTTAWRYDLDRSIPSAGRSILLSLPAGFHRYTAWRHIDPVHAAQPNASTWQWQIGPRPSIAPESAAPPRGDLAASMLLAYSGPGVLPSDGSWSAVGEWYAGLLAGRTDLSPAMRSKVAELIAGKADFLDKLSAITGFLLDDIRYVAVEMGIGGWQPHAAAAVFQTAYGDCKDKSTLLIAMLAEAGITAHPVLADFDHEIDPDMPTHYADHMITAIEVPPGVEDQRLRATVAWHGRRLLIFDPTNSVAPPGALEAELQGTWGVLLDGAQTTPLLLPVLPPEGSVLRRTGTFVLSPGGTLSGRVSETRTGSLAQSWRETAMSANPHKLREREETALRRAVPDSTLKDVAVEHAHDRGVPLHIDLEITVENYPRHAGAMLLVRPAVLPLYRADNLEDGHPRLYPIELGPERDEREDDTITLPDGYKPDDLPDPVTVQTPFALYRSAFESKGSTLYYTRELVIRSMHLPAAGKPAYEDFCGKVAAAEQAEAVLVSGH